MLNQARNAVIEEIAVRLEYEQMNTSAAIVRNLKTSPEAKSVQVAPDGWVLVPREPTLEMITACQQFMTEFGYGRQDYNAIRGFYKAMIEAAPKEPAL